MILLTFITFFVYSFSLFNPFIWDDEQFIYKNIHVINFEIKNIFTNSTTAGAGEITTYYRPITSLSFALDYAVWQNNVFGFHLTNILLHTAVGLLLFKFLQEIKINKKISFFLALVFLLHPIQTEAVTYINSRGDSLYLLFCFLSLFSLKEYQKVTDKNVSFKFFEIYDLKIEIKRKHLFLVSLIFYLFAILSKEIATAFLVILIWQIFFGDYDKNSENNKKVKLIQSLSFLTTFITYIIFRIFVLNIPIKQNYSGTDLSFYQDNLLFRFLTFLSSLWEYLSFIFLPFNLHMERMKHINTYFDLKIILVLVVITTIIALALYEIKKQKTKYIIFGGIWFFAMLFPVSGIVPINGLIYEHWLYAPIIGFMLVVYGILNLSKSIFNNYIDKYYSKNKLIAIIFQILQIQAFLIILFISILTIKQNYIWGDKIRFYEYTLQFSKTARLYNNLGISYAEVGQLDKAVEIYKKALDIDDNYPQIHINIANAYRDMNIQDKQKEHLEKALQLMQGSGDIK